MHIFDVAADDKRKLKFHTALGLEDSHGEPSWPLPNMKPSDESEFWGSMSSWGHYFTRASLRTMQLEDSSGKKRWANVHLYFVDVMQRRSGGFAVVKFYDEYVGKYPDGKYVGEVQYFTWNKCDHVFKEKNIGRCLHLYTCEKCGDSYEVDSSD
jgi:hypothetical protein